MNDANKISFLLLALLITGAIDSIRNLPASALFGAELFFFFGFAAIFFLFPVALISAELSSTYTEKGSEGVYGWTKKAFGSKFAFLAIWLQWVNTMFWFPTILSFIVATGVYMINPDLDKNPTVMATSIIIIFWVMTLINLRGLKASATFASICAFIGVIIPLTLILIFGLIWLILGKPLAISFAPENLLPNLTDGGSWISLTAIMTAFLGLELATVHVRRVKNPQKNFPRALYFSTIFILVTMIFGALAIAIVIPKEQISLVAGVLESFKLFLQAYNISWALPILVVMIITGAIGGMINWIISPAQGLLQAADEHFLPDFLDKRNKNGVPANILILQAVLVTIIGSAFILMPSVNGSYWLLTDLSTQLYLFMYILMFVAALKIKFTEKKSYPDSFKIPGGKIGFALACILGLIGTLITIRVGFIPPEGIVNTGGSFTLTFTLGLIAAISPIFIFFIYRNLKIKRLKK